MTRALAILLGLVMAANGLAMLFAGRWWYAAVPGVPATGPFNPHFVKDIGAAYLVVAGALAAFAWKPARALPALAAAAAFLTLHAAIHVADAIASRSGAADLVRDLPGIFLPALISLGLIAWALRRPKEPSHA